MSTTVENNTERRAVRVTSVIAAKPEATHVRVTAVSETRPGPDTTLEYTTRVADAPRVGARVKLTIEILR